jgi:hypothetical protein
LTAFISSELVLISAQLGLVSIEIAKVATSGIVGQAIQIVVDAVLIVSNLSLPVLWFVSFA